jgi:molybdenum cofactor biosynthesis enzyme MoaA
MCDSWKKEIKNELTVSEISRIFAQLPRMDVVRLTSGEPFMRSDFPQIVNWAQERLRPMVMHITSNGLLPDRIARFCQQRRKEIPLHLLISLDGMPQRHNHIRGLATAWE